MKTEEWINTVEYKELNFARKALVVNPAKACQPLGAFFCASGFEGTLPVRARLPGMRGLFQEQPLPALP